VKLTSPESAGGVDSAGRNAEAEERGVRAVNVLCLCGAVIGIASVFCTWSFLVSSGEIIASTSLVEHLDPYPFSPGLWFLGSVIFLAGTVIALFTTLSGFVQFAGIVVYVEAIRERAAELEGIPASDFAFGVGLGLMMGVVSSSVILFSMVLPAGQGLRTGPATLLDRILVFRLGAVRSSGSATAKAEVAEPVEGFFRSRGKWVSFIVATSLVSVGLVSVDTALYTVAPLVEQVAAGVEIDVNTLMYGYPCDYEERALRVSGEGASVEWILASEELSNGKWCVVDFGSRALGPLVISLTAMELSGDGRFGAGDSLVLVCQNGTAFTESNIYRLSWIDTTAVPRLPPPSYPTVFFVITPDGSIDSWRLEFQGYLL
jgi:hypothetical protein